HEPGAARKAAARPAFRRLSRIQKERWGVAEREVVPAIYRVQGLSLLFLLRDVSGMELSQRVQHLVADGRCGRAAELECTSQPWHLELALQIDDSEDLVRHVLSHIGDPCAIESGEIAVILQLKRETDRVDLDLRFCGAD